MVINAIMRSLLIVLVAALSICPLACSNETQPPPTTSTTQSPQTDDPTPTTEACVIADDCNDIDVFPLTTKACCTTAYSCGYEVQPVDDRTLMWYPDLPAQIKELTKADPNGRCAPESFYFGPDVGMIEQRFEKEGLPDILIADTCTSYHIGDFSFAGCCLPDDSCGLSTHSYWTILEGLAMDPNAPFSQPECVPADTLNQQLRDSTLGTLARLKSGGSCNYAEIDARQPNTLD